jgi:predicted phage-related endonuclease
MKIIDIPGGQGSQAWHEHRRAHWNASDAPAMMGCCPHRKRNELLHELHTGLQREFSDYKQSNVIDDGHRAEALARPLAEQAIGDDLYPITVTNGRLSASLDGATLDGAWNFEHKRLNNELRAVLKFPGQNGDVGEQLPLNHRVQMEHQLHCSGGQRTLFMASEWSADGTLVDMRHCVYLPNLALRAQVLAGWAQFEQDLAAYQAPEAKPAIAAAPQEHLPAVSVQLQGALAVVSNLQPFGVALRAFIERIPKKPTTDQEFVDTEAACKRLKEAEDRLAQAEDSALASMADVETMRRMVAEFRDLARTARLASEKLVKQRKEQIREEEVQRGARAVGAHIVALNKRLGGLYMPGVAANFGGVIKGLKTLDSVRNAIDTELARAKIAANEVADRIDANIKAIGATGAPSLFADFATLVLKAPDDLAAVIAQRLHAEQQRQEAERARIRAEEAQRAEQQRNTEAAKATSLPGTPGACASTESQAAQGSGSGEGEAAHAGQRAADPDFEALEREHFGDADRKTGIYHDSRHAATLHAQSPITMVEPLSTRPPYPNPTDADLADPLFEAVWQCIKTWDVHVPEFDGPSLYAGANGSHALLIVRAVRAALKVAA